MSNEPTAVTFDRLTEFDADRPTLVEGLPGHGLVASIAVDQITTQLELEHHGNVVSRDFPQITSFKDGRVRDTVRVYAGEDPAIMTLQSDVALPSSAYDALGRCILDELTGEFQGAVFLTGAPARTEAEVGDVFGVATTDAVEADLRDAGIDLREGIGLVGGITGALVNACYHADVPAAVLVVKANPYMPDPQAAQSVIDTALEPLLGFDIDTTELEEQADEIRSQMEQIAQRYQQLMQGTREEAEEPSEPVMYQ